jgi:predicted transcriptional regulator
MAGKPVTNPAGKVFAALACDLRLRVLNGVNAGHTCTAALAEHLGIPSATVSKATEPLVRAGLLSRRQRNWAEAGKRGLYEFAVTPLARDLIRRTLAERSVLAALRVVSEERAA